MGITGRVNVAYTNLWSKMVDRFSCVKQWPSMIAMPLDQDDCLSCCAFACSSVLSDRIRIASHGTRMVEGGNLDYIVPQVLAARMACHTGLCRKGCRQKTDIETVLKFLCTRGGVSKFQLQAYGLPDKYDCYNHVPANARGVSYERVSIHTHPETPRDIYENIEAVKRVLRESGPVVATMRQYRSLDTRDLRLFSGDEIYGLGWQVMPTVDWDYHCISIIGYDYEVIQGVKVGYWICRNSWGTGWNPSMSGCFYAVMGSSLLELESDVWAIQPEIH